MFYLNIHFTVITGKSNSVFYLDKSNVIIILVQVNKFARLKHCQQILFKKKKQNNEAA